MCDSTNCDNNETFKKKSAGRPPKLSSQQTDILRAIAIDQPTATMAKLVDIFQCQAGVTLTTQTARKYLEASGLVRVRPAREPKSGPGEVSAASEATEASHPARYGYLPMHRDEGEATRYPHGLTDVEWDLVRDLFAPPETGRPAKYDRREIVNACCYVVRSGCPWRMMPKDLPPWQNVYAHFRRWSARGLFESMHDRLRAMWRKREERNVEPTAAIIDSQSVKTSAQGGPKGFDGGKKVKGRKRHLVTDTLGLVLAVFVTVAGIQDRDALDPAITLAKTKYPTLRKAFVDGGYAGSRASQAAAKHKMDIEVVRHPGNRNVGRWQDAQLPLFAAPRGFVVLPRRWVIERTNAWNDRCRRLEKDQDRRLDVSEAWVWLAQARLLLHRVAFAPVAA